MRGKTVIVTGATAGIGRVVCGRLATMGASLALVARDPAKTDALAAELVRGGAAHVSVHVADLSCVAEVRRVAGELAALPRLDVLLNNAGAIFSRREQTADGFERTFALNHLAYFALTNLLLDRFKATAPARIVNVASEAHRGAALDFADLQTARGYSGWLAYKRSKLCNILFTRTLARRLASSGVTANALHPGFVATSFGNNNGGLFRAGLGLAKRVMAVPPAEGAKTPVYLVSAPEVAGLSGLYFDKCASREPSAAAQDDDAAERLWRESARLAAIG
ncbi:MAG: SDR family oxidoreductase [Alphaproteobacteria bacterium]|nr:SDR family oxidoreductase [Alphaproteobacteria bacterium]